MPHSEILLQFINEINIRSDKINRLAGDEAMGEQIKLSAFISEGMQALLKQGYTVSKVQDAIREAMSHEDEFAVNDTIADSNSAAGNSPAKDDEQGVQGTVSRDEIEPGTYLFMINSKTPDDYAKGGISQKELCRLLFASSFCFCEELEMLEAVLSQYGKASQLEGVFSGGEILAGADGEAFLPMWLEIEDESGGGSLICEPAVYKTKVEIEGYLSQLELINEQDFKAKFDIKKLAKALGIEGKAFKVFKRAKNEIFKSLWESFERLRCFYKGTAAENKYILFVEAY